MGSGWPGARNTASGGLIFLIVSVGTLKDLLIMAPEEKKQFNLEKVLINYNVQNKH